MRDSALVLPIVLVTVLGGTALASLQASVQAQVQQVMTLLAVAGAVAAALTLSFAGRLDGDAAALRIGSALLVYGGLALPITAAGFAASIGPVGQMLDLLALGSVAVLLGVAVVRPGEPTLSWPAAAVAVAVSLAAVASTALLPGLMPGPLVLTVAFGVVAAVLFAFAVALTAAGLRRRSVLLRRVGLGVGLLAVAQAGRGLAPLGVVVPWPALTGLRPIAVAVILAGVVPHALAALRRQRERDIASALALRAAAEEGEAARRSAHERDHELRNLVLGLTGAAALLSRPGTAERSDLGAAVTAELQRLNRMLDRDGAPRGEETGSFDVRAALEPAVAVRRASGMRIDLDVAPGVRACGTAAELTQVVTNLLVNCARHAAGSAVLVSAARLGDRIVVRVRDHGPGIAVGEEEAVLLRGHRSAVTGGRGLGLAISRDLVRARGGELRLAAAPDGPGCLATVEIPAARPARPAVGLTA